MSSTITVPRGLDTLTAEETALMESMRDDGPEPTDSPAAPDADPASLAPEPEEPADIELPEEIEQPRADGRRTVPHAQFHAAREEAKAAKTARVEAEARATAAETKLATEAARINERITILAALAQGAPAAPAPAPVATEEALPDVNVDPIGHFQKLAERQSKQIEALTGITQGFQERLQVEQRVQEFRNWGVAQEVAFEAAEPSYRAAMDHLKLSRHEELEAIGVADPVERERIIAGDVNAIAEKARRDGVNFAERLYKLSQKRGFAKAAPAVAQPAATGPVIPPLDADPALTARAARTEEARGNAMTIGSVGAAPAPRLSVERISNMSDREFEALTDKLRAAGGTALRDLMGH